jgi:hypothetical protein
MSTKENGSGVPARLTDANFAKPSALPSIQERLAAEIGAAGGEIPPDPELTGSIGTTMFDLPGSEDNTVTVVLPRESAQKAASQALVRIKSRKKNGDGRQYVGMVTAGPFAEPDSLRGDSHMLVTVATRGGTYEPPYHGRVQVTILGEELPHGTLCPPRLRPLPNSPVFALSDEDSATVLKTAGDIRLGVVVGHPKVTVGVPSDQEARIATPHRDPSNDWRRQVYDGWRVYPAGTSREHGGDFARCRRRVCGAAQAHDERGHVGRPD